MKICYCADHKMLDLLKMSAESVLKFNPDAEIFVISKNKMDVPYQNILLDTHGFDFKIPESSRFTETTYYRLYLPALGFERCIYLDCDTLCYGSLKVLWNMDVPYLGICHGSDISFQQKTYLHIPMYAIDTVMLMNCSALNKILFTQTCLRAFHNIVSKKCFGETLLNALYYDIFTFIPVKYCFCMNRKYDLFKNEYISMKDSVIRHYVGADKSQMAHDYKILTGETR